MLKHCLSIWYIWCKSCTYLGPTLALSPNGPKQDSTSPTSPRCYIGCFQTNFQAYGTFDAKRATILHRRQHSLQTDRNEISHDPCHLGVPSGASKTISNPMVRSTQTAHLSCVKISTISTWTANRARLAQTGHLGVPSGASKTISNQLYCTDANTVSKQTQMRFHMTHIT